MGGDAGLLQIEEFIDYKTVRIVGGRSLSDIDNNWMRNRLGAVPVLVRSPRGRMGVR